jgi:hypothetical protein
VGAGQVGAHVFDAEPDGAQVAEGFEGRDVLGAVAPVPAGGVALHPVDQADAFPVAQRALGQAAPGRSLGDRHPVVVHTASIGNLKHFKSSGPPA